MLAQSLGMSVSRLEVEVDAEELQGWKEYWSQNPEHEERADRRHGMLCHLLSILKQGKIPKSHEPLDFMPYSKQPPKPEPTVEGAMALMRVWAHAQNSAAGVQK